MKDVVYFGMLLNLFSPVMLSSHIQLTKLLYLNYNFMGYKIFTDVTAKDKTLIKIDIHDRVPMKSL